MKKNKYSDWYLFNKISFKDINKPLNIDIKSDKAIMTVETLRKGLDKVGTKELTFNQKVQIKKTKQKEEFFLSKLDEKNKKKFKVKKKLFELISPLDEEEKRIEEVMAMANIKTLSGIFRLINRKGNILGEGHEHKRESAAVSQISHNVFSSGRSSATHRVIADKPISPIMKKVTQTPLLSACATTKSKFKLKGEIQSMRTTANTFRNKGECDSYDSIMNKFRNKLAQNLKTNIINYSPSKINDDMLITNKAQTFYKDTNKVRLNDVRNQVKKLINSCINETKNTTQVRKSKSGFLYDNSSIFKLLKL
jgi:hypothetical protein